MPKKSVPTIEELFSRLETRLASFEDKTERTNKELEGQVGCISHKVENTQTFVRDLAEKKDRGMEEKVRDLFEKVYSMDSMFREESEDTEQKFLQLDRDMESLASSSSQQEQRMGALLLKVDRVERELKTELASCSQKADSVASFKERLDLATSMIDSIQEKMYDFETNKKNNLIFYGVPGEGEETPDQLLFNMQEIIRINLNIAREVNISGASRVLGGPEVKGCRPVLVTFSSFKDRQEVFQNSKFVKKTCSISVTEDMSKKTREARQELRRYLVNLKKQSPEKRCFIQYDKLYIDGKVFCFSHEEGKVIPFHSGSDSPTSKRSMFRSVSSMSFPSPSYSRCSSSLSTPDLRHISVH